MNEIRASKARVFRGTQLDDLPGIDLRLPLEPKVIGITGGVQAAERRLVILQRKLEPIGIELLGRVAEPAPLEGLEDRLQPLDPDIGLALGIGEIGQCAF